jgi:hypothetical protein
VDRERLAEIVYRLGENLAPSCARDALAAADQLEIDRNQRATAR